MFFLFITFVLVILFALPSVIDFGKNTAETSQLALLKLFMKDNAEIRDGELYRLLTPAFFHWDIFHLISNIYGLYLFSGFWEPQISVVIYLVSAIAGNIASYFFNPHLSVGASGAVYGFVGYLVMASVIDGYTSSLTSIFIYLAVSVAYAFTPGSQIDLSAHVGGFFGGILTALLVSLI